MVIVPAIAEQANEIALLLVNHFKVSNQLYKYSKYKTELQPILSHVLDRINSGSSDFTYFILEDGGVMLGFVNCMSTSKASEILALCLKKEFDNEKNAEMLLNYGVEYLKKKGAESVTFEVIETQIGLRSVATRLWGRVIEQKYII